MEAEFQPNEQSIEDMVTREVQKKSLNPKLLKTQSLPAHPPTPEALAVTPDPFPEAEIKPNLVRALTGKRHKGDRAAREREVHKHLVNSSAVLHSLVVVPLLAGDANRQKTLKAAPTAP